jgi:hypothetical protein
MTLPRSDEADANTRFSKRPILCTTLAIWREKSNIQVSVLAAGHNFEDMVRKPGRKLARGDENTLLFFAPRTRIGFGFPAGAVFTKLEYLILNHTGVGIASESWA